MTKPHRDGEEEVAKKSLEFESRLIPVNVRAEGMMSQGPSGLVSEGAIMLNNRESVRSGQ